MNRDFRDMGGGIIQDLPPEQLKPNQWSDGNNVRFVRAQVSRITGQTEVFGTSSASGTIGSLALSTAVYLQNINDDNDNPWWIYCSLDRIHATDGSTHLEITHSATTSASQSALFAATEDYGWNGGNFNGMAILNSHAQLPRYWVPDSGIKTIELTVSAVFTSCRVIRPYKTFLMAIGVDEGTGFNDNVVLWPTASDVGGLPPSWDYSDPTEDAGRVELDDGFGKLIDGARLRNDFFVYAEHAIYRFSPIPGNDIFSIRRQFSEVGVLTRNCIATIRNRHVFFGDGDIYVHDGQTIESIITKRWKDWVFSQMGVNWRRSYVCPNYKNNEVWFCFPVSTNEYPTKALVWDFDDNTISSRDLLDPADVYGISHIAYGKLPSSSDDSFDSGDNINFDTESVKAFNETDSEINAHDMVSLKYTDLGGTTDTITGSTIGVLTNRLLADINIEDEGARAGDIAVNTSSSASATITSLFGSLAILTTHIFPTTGQDFRIDLANSPLSSFFKNDQGHTFDGYNFTSYVEKDALPLGRDGKFNQYEEYQISTIRPRVKSVGGGDLTIKLSMRDSIGDARTWTESATFVMGVDDKVDVRVTGTVCAIRFESSADTDWELNGFGVDYEVVGSRQR